MEAKGLFTNFRYKSFFSPLKKKVCIEVSFLYHDKPIKRFIFIDKYPEVDYIQEAKRIIEQEINNGKLEKYCKRYGHNSKPALIAIIIIAFLVVIAGLGYLGYKYLSPGKTPTFDASITMSEPIEGYSVSLTNEKVVKGQPYTTNIKFTHPTEYVYRLPNALEKVSVGGIATTNYTYKISDPIKEATFTIPAEAVTGKVDITIKLEKIQPTLVDINGVNCVGCTVDAGQKAEFGSSMFSFKVTLNPQYTDHEITKLAINNVPLTKNVDYQPLFVVGNNEFKISLLNGKKVDGTIAVTVTGYQLGDTKIELSSSDLWLCDTNDTHLLNNATMFNAADGCTVRLEMPQPVVTTNHVPLDIKVTAGNTLLNYGQYNYYFVDDEIAELVIDPIVAALGDITITANSTPSIAQFVCDAQEADSVTLSFQATEENCYLPSITWGDNSGSVIASDPMEVGKTYDMVHTYTSTGVKVIDIKREAGSAPQLIGFNANNDIRPGADVYPDISAPLANYATGTSHIKSARIGNSFKGFIEEGIAYTGINSFCVPSSFTDMSTTAKHFANCANLDSICVAPNNKQMCSDGGHKLLFTKVKSNQLRVKVLANVKSDSVILDTYNNMNIIGVEAFAAAGRTISSITFGQYCEPGRIDRGLLAGANVNTISVDSNNPYFIVDSNNALVANNDGIYSVYATTANTKLEIYSAATNIHLLPYSIAVMQSVNTERPVTLYPYSVYSNSALQHFTTGDVEFSEELTRDSEPYHLAAIYNCSNLAGVTLNNILSEKCLTAGLIQKCPKVTSLVAKNSDYYGASTDTIYYADGKDKGAAIVVATCSASLLADPQTAGIDWYIKDFAPYVFNGNAFGINRVQVAPPYLYITEKVTSLSEYSCIGMSGNVDTYISIDTKNLYYDAQNNTTSKGAQRLVTSKEDGTFDPKVTLFFAMLDNNLGEVIDTLILSKNIEAVEAGAMISDDVITTVATATNKNDTIEFKDEAFYNCPNLTTINLSSLSAGVVPTIHSTRAFIQPECSPFSPKTIKVIVNSESVDEFKAHSVWSKFTIVPANI